MKASYQLFLAVCLLIAGCGNEEDEETHAASGKLTRADSSQMIDADVYQLESDTLIQQAYIKYLSEKSISFLLVSQSRLDNSLCKLSDTISLSEGEPGAYIDQTLGDQLYPVYEFVKEKDSSHINIGIEPSRGERLAVSCSRDYDNTCNNKTPFTSATLRLVKKSPIDFPAPMMPPVPQ